MSVVTLAPGAAANGGGGDQGWINASNVLADDSDYAVVSLGSGQTSDILQVDNFGFAIPTGATILGIALTIKRDSLGDTVDSSIRVVDSTGTPQGSDKADGVTTWPGSFGTGSYGSSSDDWSAGLDDADINSTSFGFRIQCTTASGSSARIQYVEASVYYSGGTTGDVPSVIVHRARKIARRRLFQQTPLSLLSLGDLGEVTEVDSSVVPAIVSKVRRLESRRARQPFIGFVPDATTSTSTSAFVPLPVFLRAKLPERRRPLVSIPWPVPAGNGETCLCPFGAVIVSLRFATARIVAIDSDPFIPSVSGPGLDRPSLAPSVSATAVVVESTLATAQIVSVCHC